jgi:hypothetical protein
MNAQTAFANAVSNRSSIECPAMWTAIDRILEGEGFRGVSGMLEAMSGANYTALDFNSALLSAWKPADIKRASGRSRDQWISLADQMERRAA